MKHKFLALVTIIGLFLAPISAFGHHGWAAFDSNSTVTFKATVTEFHFVNPHSVVEFDVDDGHGRVQKWEGELTSNLRLALKGWKANSLEAGTPITITGYRAQSGVNVIRVIKIVLASGKELQIEPGN
ncbi:MAG: hypothetical protein JO323_24430 [Acidobacteriia bacterium]|nr:hypothetical protein [Terriglobia bacterium]